MDVDIEDNSVEPAADNNLLLVASRDEDGNFQETQTSRYDHEPHQVSLFVFSVI